VSTWWGLEGEEGAEQSSWRRGGGDIVNRRDGPGLVGPIRKKTHVPLCAGCLEVGGGSPRGEDRSSRDRFEKKGENSWCRGKKKEYTG